MKKGLWVLVACLAVAAAGYGVYYGCATASARAMLSRPEGQMEWLRREFHLSNAEFVRIQALHRDCAPRCALMCGRIQEADARVNGLMAGSAAVTPELEAALHALATVREACAVAMLTQACAVAQEMSPADGVRYLKMMKGRVLEASLQRETLFPETDP
jgi:hypothetical protein